MKITKTLFIILSLCFNFLSCSQNNSSYYAALRYQAEGNPYEAKRLFNKAIKEGSPLVKRLSFEELIEQGNIRQKLEACELFAQEYNDEKALLLISRQYSKAEEYSKIIFLTNETDCSKCINELAYIRLEAMFKKNDTRFYKEFYTWFTSKPLSQLHYKLYCEVSKSQDFAFQKESPIFDFRADVYKRNYKVAYQKLQEQQDSLPLIPQLVSDIGKVCLYGNTAYYQNALYFEKLAKKITGDEAEFYAWFYSGRLYEKAGNYFTLAANRFKYAMECTKTPSNYDNALWYLINLSLKRSTKEGIKVITKYCSTWNNPEYFEDIFETITPLMLSEGLWDDFYTLYKAIDGYATDETTAKLAYIYGRLVQVKLAAPLLTDSHGSEADAAFTRALSSGSEPYYRALASTRLGIAGEHEEEILLSNKINSDLEIDEDAQEVLLSYASYGFPERIYPMWLRFSEEGRNISYESGIKLASFLKDCGANKNEFYPQSLRIAVKTIKLSGRTISKKDLELLYPRDYSSIIEEKCKKYNIPEDIMYALVRSESFFDCKVGSSAGAVGLSQLMKPTAEDIAHRLKYGQYDLRNPQDNLEFGTWYLANLWERLDNEWLPTFFSYNAGINTVRRWKKSSRIEFNNMKNLPDDLFLETIPYEETRGYGRKLVGAASMYAWLYYGKSILQEVNTLMNDKN